MNQLKRYLGILWMLLGPSVLIMLIASALKHANNGGTKDINNPVPWIIIIVIFIPIAIGLMVFGWYSLKGAYDDRS